jgi:hypothetical protein
MTGPGLFGQPTLGQFPWTAAEAIWCVARPATIDMIRSWAAAAETRAPANTDLDVDAPGMTQAAATLGHNNNLLIEAARP